MPLEIHIDKTSHIPAYRQIIEKITILIKNGKLKPGDKLTPERDLANELGIARGTIKKAYDELERNLIIEVIQGRGTFVTARQHQRPGKRKDKALHSIDKLLMELENMKFSYREIRTFIELKIMEREERLDNFYIAAIDCNPESLTIYEKQLILLSNVKIKKFLIEELSLWTNPEERLENYELILTTSTHYQEIIENLPGLSERISQVIVSPSQETVIELASISSDHKIGIVTESARFLEIIESKLKSFMINTEKLKSFFINSGEDFNSFINSLDIIILPPGYSLPKNKDTIAIIQNYRERGGKIICFEYQIEEGSLLHIGERIKELRG